MLNVFVSTATITNMLLYQNNLSWKFPTQFTSQCCEFMLRLSEVWRELRIPYMERLPLCQFVILIDVMSQNAIQLDFFKRAWSLWVFLKDIQNR